MSIHYSSCKSRTEFLNKQHLTKGSHLLSFPSSTGAVAIRESNSIVVSRYANPLRLPALIAPTGNNFPRDERTIQQHQDGFETQGRGDSACYRGTGRSSR